MTDRQPGFVKRSGSILAIALTLAACGAGGFVKPASQEQSGESAPMSISIMHPMYDEEPKKAAVWSYIEDRFQIRYDPVPVPSNSYGDKLMLAVSSGKLPDVVIWTSYYTEMVNFIRNGMFHDLTDYVAGSDHLVDIPREVWARIAVDGRYYGIPRPRAEVGQAVMIRKDWLDRLELPLPVTIDDYYTTAARFGQRDPDRNGKADTYGFAAGEGLNFLHHLFPAFGAGNTWIMREDGTLEASKVSAEREEGMIWLRSLYAERGIDPSFSTLKTTQVWERVMDGKAGIIIASVSDFDNIREGLLAREPNAELVMLGPPQGKHGEQLLLGNEGFHGMFMIPASVPLDKVERILSLLDWQAGEEGYRIRKYGLAGIHHTIAADGSLEIDRQALREDNPEQLLLMNPYDPYFYVSIHAEPAIQQQQIEILDLIRDKGIENPAYGYVSEASLDVASLYSKQVQRFETDFVKGKVKLEEFAQFRREWLEKGGAEVTREVNEWYRSLKQTDR